MSGIQNRSYQYSQAGGRYILINLIYVLLQLAFLELSHVATDNVADCDEDTIIFIINLIS